MSNTLWDENCVVVGEFKVYRNGKVEQFVDGKWNECNSIIIFPNNRRSSYNVPEVRISYLDRRGRFVWKPLHVLMMMALTGEDNPKSCYARPIDGDVHNTNYKNYKILKTKGDLLKHNNKLLEQGYYCELCFSYNKNGTRCRGCRRLESYLEELSGIYPNTDFLSKLYKELMDTYNTYKGSPEVTDKVMKIAGGGNRLDTMIDNLYDAKHIVWKSRPFCDIYQKMTIEDTITVNELVRLNMTVEEFMEFALTLNSEYKYKLFVGFIKGEDADILIKESALID